MRPTFPSVPQPRWLTWLWPTAVFLILATATFVFWRTQRDILAAEQQSEFEHNAALVTVELRDRLNLHAQFLRTLGAYFATQQPVDARQWQLFSQRIRLEDSLPGAHLFGFAPAVAARDLKAFEAKMRSAFKRDDFGVFPPSAAELMVPAVYLAPQREAAARSLGFDIYSEAVRRQAIDLASATDDVVISGRIVLIFDQDNPTPGFLMLYPVYRQGMPTASVDQKRAAFAGVVFAAYRLDELMQFLTWTVGEYTALRIVDVDGPGGEASALYGAPSPDQAPAAVERSSEHEVAFGHRRWLLQFQQHARPTPPHTLGTPSHTLLAGLTISALFTLVFFVLTTHRQRAEAYARRVTTDLLQAEASIRAADRQKQAVLDAATEIAITATDTQGTITVFNRGAEKMLGYRASDLIGRKTPEIFHLAAEVEARARVLSTELGQEVAGFDTFVALPRLRGSEQREWTYVRADGQPLRVDLVVTTQRSDNGNITGYLGVAVDVTERNLAEAELERHRDNLQNLVLERTAELEAALQATRAATQAKSEILANMSHELRTPMHAILSFSGLGIERSGGPGNEKLHQYFERIRQSAERLLDLINDLLDLSKLEAGRMDMALTGCDILPLVQRTVTDLESLLLVRQLKVSVESGPHAFVHGNEKQIERVIHNLLSNAIKFSPPDSTIAIRIEATDLPDFQDSRTPAVAVTVTDSGIGIPPEELETIFEKFVQGSKTKTGAGGTGLGLAICREIVLAHHGTISAKSIPGGGASFEVKLPAYHQKDSKPE